MNRLSYKLISIFLILTYTASLITPPPALANWIRNGQLGGTVNVGGADDEPPQPTCPSPTTPKPIYIFSGEKIYSCQDLFIPGPGMNLDIRHVYASGYHSSTPFGYGWSLNYHQRLKVLEGGNVLISRGTGLKYGYTSSYDGFSTNEDGSYAPPPGRFEILVRNVNGTWTLTEAQGTKYNFNTTGLLTSIVDRNGNTITLSYSESGEFLHPGYSLYSQNEDEHIPVSKDYRLTEITGTNGRTVELNYDGNGRLEYMEDDEGRRVTYTYDEETDDLLTITKPETTQFPEGVTTTFTYDSGHNMLTIEDAKGQVFVDNHYEGEKITQQDLGSGTMYLEYAGEGEASETTVTDRNGFETLYNFNHLGNPTRIEEFTNGLRSGEPVSYASTITYNSDSMKTLEEFPKGNGIKYTYNTGSSNQRSQGNLLEIRRKADMSEGDNDTNDIVTDITYESQFNQIKSITDPNGEVTLFVYDYELLPSHPDHGHNGNLVKVQLPAVASGTPVWQASYNDDGQITRITDPNGNVTEYEYDATTGYLEVVTRDPGGIEAVTNITYDVHGNIDTVTDANGHETDYDFDELGWLNQVENPLDFVTKYTYDANGNVEMIERQATTGRTPDWQTTEFTYTNMNKVATVEDPLDRVTTYSYDDEDQLSSVEDAENNVTGYVWDERGLLFTVTDATTTGTTVYDYDINGNITLITDAEGNETEYAFDLFDRLDTTTYEDSTFSEYAYDKNSNLIQHTTPADDDIVYDYDDLNRLIEKGINGGPSLATYAYDLSSRLIAADNSAVQNDFTYDELDRVTANGQRFNSITSTVTYDYDAVGNREEIVYPSTRDVDYEYDDHDRLDLIKVNSSNFVDYDHDPLDRRTKKDYLSANLPEATYSYDIANQLESVMNELGSGTDVSKYEYFDYDGVGNRENMRRTLQTTVNGTINYDYNEIYELTTVTGSQSNSYAYDQVGNRTTADSVSYTANALNQYTDVGVEDFTYDDNGNLTTDGTNIYAYDEENRLESLNAPGSSNDTTYEYDAFNRRVRKNVNGTSTYFFYDGDEIIAEYNSGGSVVAEYVTGDQIDEVLAMYRSGNVYYYHYDGLGSVTEITSSAGSLLESYRYGPYGSIRASAMAIGNPYYFTGRQFDPESGIYYYRARMYDPSTGRFIQRDPLGYEDGMNLFAYVKNNPINFIDPFGKQVVVPGPIVLPVNPPVTVTPPLVTLPVLPPVNNAPSRGNSDPTSGLTPVNPGTDSCGNCNPCPAATYWDDPNPGHGGQTHHHGIEWNQDPSDCMCYPKRISRPGAAPKN